jgi:hypothetical protein
MKKLNWSLIKVNTILNVENFNTFDNNPISALKSSRLSENVASKKLKGRIIEPSQKIDMILSNESEPRPEALVHNKIIDSQNVQNNNSNIRILSSEVKIKGQKLNIEGSEITSEISKQESHIDDEEISYKRKISTITAEVNVILKLK